MINVGIIGYGYWGPNLTRNFQEAETTRVTMVADLDGGRLRKLRDRYPSIRATTDARELLSSSDVDAVAVATPVSTHFELAMAALRAGKHVLVEKPMTATVEQAVRLIEEAERRHLVLMVDHTFVYTGAVRKVREIVSSGALGEFYYYDSVRVNLGLFQHDVNVIWDLAVHDLAIMDHVLPVKPTAVSATGISHVPGQPENVAYVTLLFEGGQIAHVHVNWLAPVKVRKTLLGGSERMVVYDDLEPSEKIKLYDKGITVNGSVENVYKMLIDYRVGDMCAPYLDPTEALRREVDHFADCITRRRRPATDGEAGLRVVQILESATESMSMQGRPVALHADNVDNLRLA